jgi:nitroreductase
MEPREDTMDVIETIRTTRAIRRYTDEAVSDEEIWTCLRAAMQAPSGGNIQPWRFLVVRDPDKKQRIGELYGKAYDRYEKALLASLPPFPNEAAEAGFDRTRRASRHLAEHLGEAQALVLVLAARIDLTLRDAEGPLDIGTIWASVYPAVQNLMLAARALGIGTALTTVYRIRQDDVRAVCGIPEQWEIAALVPMGRPSGSFGVAPRRPVESVTYWNHYGERYAESDPASRR